MPQESTSIYASGEELEVLDSSTISEEDLLTSKELQEFTDLDADSAADDVPPVFSPDDGSFYVVGQATQGREINLSGAVPVEEAREQLDLED